MPVDEHNGCLQVIPGSHRWGWVDHHTEMREGNFLEAPIKPEDEAKAVTCRMQPGDVLWMGADSACQLEPGSVVDIEISGIGVLSNPVEAEPKGAGDE